MGSRIAWFAGCALATLIGVYLITPESRTSDVLYFLIGAIACVGIVIGLRLRRPEDSRAWWLIAGSQMIWVAGDSLYIPYAGMNPISRWIPSPLDNIYLLGYLPLLAGLAMIRPWDRTTGRSDLIDSASAALGLGLLAWMVFVVPFLDGSLGTPSSRFVDFAYPTFDLVALGLSLRLVLGNVRRTASGALLIFAMALVAVADVHNGLGALLQASRLSQAVNAAWLLSYASIAVAALLPSVRQVVTPSRDRLSWEPRTRVAFHWGLALLGLGVVLIESRQGHSVVVAVLVCAGALLCVLAIARIGLLVNSLENALADVRLRDRAIASVGSGIAIIDATSPDGLILDVNPAYERMTGFSRGDLVGRSIASLEGETFDRQTISRIAGTIRDGVATESVGKSVRQDGMAFWCEFRTAPVIDESGRLTHVVGVLDDVTTRIEAEREMRFQGELLDQAFAAVVATNPDGIVTHWNRHAEELYGWPRTIAIGSRYDDLGIGPNDSRVEAEIRQSITSGTRWEGQIQVNRGDGSAVWVRTSVSPVVAADATDLGFVSVAADIGESKAVEDRLAYLAFHDPLTDLPNRSLFTKRLSAALERSRDDAAGAGVVFVDLDRFKGINDHLGHVVGDELLRIVASRLRGALRETDTLARFGGDEFVALVEGVTSDGLMRIVDRMRETLENPVVLAGQEIFVHASFGVAMASESHASHTELLSSADVALYRAKSRGRNQTVVFEAGMHVHPVSWFALEADLRHAIERGDELQVFYQPVIDISSGRVEALEALIRWRHPTRGLVLPGEFLPLAEATDLISGIAFFVLEEACRQFSAWKHAGEGLTVPAVNVNIAARQLIERDLAGRIAQTLRRFDLRPDELRLELSEAVLIEELRTNATTLRELEALGVRFAIDDFGAGASSLAALREVRADILKLDKGFVRNLESDYDDRAVVAAVASLAHELGMLVTAEGIETEIQARIARSLGCDRCQGFLFSPALPADEVINFVRDGSAHERRLVFERGARDLGADPFVLKAS